VVSNFSPRGLLGINDGLSKMVIEDKMDVDFTMCSLSSNNGFSRPKLDYNIPFLPSQTAF